MATVVLIVHAAPDSKVETLALSLLAAGRPVYTFDHPANAALLAAGAKPVTPETDWTVILPRTCLARKSTAIPFASSPKRPHGVADGVDLGVGEFAGGGQPEAALGDVFGNRVALLAGVDRFGVQGGVKGP